MQQNRQFRDFSFFQASLYFPLKSSWCSRSPGLVPPVGAVWNAGHTTLRRKEASAEGTLSSRYELFGVLPDEESCLSLPSSQLLVSTPPSCAPLLLLGEYYAWESFRVSGSHDHPYRHFSKRGEEVFPRGLMCPRVPWNSLWTQSSTSNS